MEEKNKISYEQLENAVKALQQRCMQAEMNLSAINLTTARLNYLFKVVELSDHFDPNFVLKCTEEIEYIMTVEEPKEEEEKEEK